MDINRRLSTWDDDDQKTPRNRVMKRCLTLSFVALGAGLIACSPSEPEASASSPPAPEVETVAEMRDERPVEGTSFGGTPLYRNGIDAERAGELQAQIDALEASSSLTEDDYIKLGSLYIAGNRFSDSIDLYTRGLEAHPESFKLRRHRGHRYINLRQLDKAIVDLREAVALMGSENSDVLEYNSAGEPTATYEHWVWYHIGLYHYLNEQWDEAAVAYQKCVDTSISNPNRVGATDWLYNALRKGGRHDEAAAAIAKIPADMDTNREHPYFKRVMVYKGELSPGDVIDVDKPVSDWNGFDITAGYGIANWHAFSGDTVAAERIHRSILETPFWNAWAFVVTDKEYEDR